MSDTHNFKNKIDKVGCYTVATCLGLRVCLTSTKSSEPYSLARDGVMKQLYVYCVVDMHVQPICD